MKKFSNEVFVYLAPVSDRMPKAVPEVRRKELLKVKNEAFLRQKNSVWALLETALFHAFAIPPGEVDFRRGENGKYTAKGVFFSLTHTERLVAVAAARIPVGIDAEEEEPFLKRYQNSPERLLALARRVAAPGEEKEASEPEGFLRLWTGKEAAFKAGGDEVFCPKNIMVSRLPVFSARVKEPCRARVSVCAECGAEPSFFFCDPEPVKMPESAFLDKLQKKVKKL